MSIETRKSGRKTTYIVRPPDGRGGRLPAERFFRRRAAEEFQDLAADAVKLGPAAVDRLYRRGPTFAEYVAEVWLPQHAHHRAVRTYEQYVHVIRKHLAPTFADVKLFDITIGTVKLWQAERQRAKTGPEVLRRAHIILGQVLQHAVEAEVIAANPVRNVRKTSPSQKVGSDCSRRTSSRRSAGR